MGKGSDVLLCKNEDLVNGLNCSGVLVEFQ